MKKEQEEARKSFFKTVDEVRERTKDISFEEIEKKVSEAVSAVRKKKRKFISPI